jgi:hypothetical protein
MMLAALATLLIIFNASVITRHGPCEIHMPMGWSSLFELSATSAALVFDSKVPERVRAGWAESVLNHLRILLVSKTQEFATNEMITRGQVKLHVDPVPVTFIVTCVVFVHSLLYLVLQSDWHSGRAKILAPAVVVRSLTNIYFHGKQTTLASARPKHTPWCVVFGQLSGMLLGVHSKSGGMKS